MDVRQRLNCSGRSRVHTTTDARVTCGGGGEPAKPLVEPGKWCGEKRQFPIIGYGVIAVPWLLRREEVADGRRHRVSDEVRHVRTLDHLGADLEMAERKVPPPQDDVEEVPVISGPRERQALGEIEVDHSPGSEVRHGHCGGALPRAAGNACNFRSAPLHHQ
jgi:hypothetical protein